MKKLFLSLFLLHSINGFSQLIFDTSKPLDTLIQEFIGSGITLSNVTFTGSNLSIGTFNGSSSLVSSQGLVITNGKIDSMISKNYYTFLNNDIGLSGDSDLNTLIPTFTTFDAAVLEFDFVATNNTLLFDYVFASEEYSDWVNTMFNDVFAFFISGPGIIGKQNLALIPGTSTAVAINTINNGGPYQDTAWGPCNNCIYFHDNIGDTSVAFDGFTTPLIVQYNLIPGLTYHLKIAVADANDHIYDSGVFLQKYSLRSINTTSVQEEETFQHKIYYSDNIIHIKTNQRTSCSIYSSDGHLIIEKQLSNYESIVDATKFSKGIYFVRLKSNKEYFTQKISVQ